MEDPAYVSRPRSKSLADRWISPVDPPERRTAGGEDNDDVDAPTGTGTPGRSDASSQCDADIWGDGDEDDDEEPAKPSRPASPPAKPMGYCAQLIERLAAQRAAAAPPPLPDSAPELPVQPPPPARMDPCPRPAGYSRFPGYLAPEPAVPDSDEDDAAAAESGDEKDGDAFPGPDSSGCSGYNPRPLAGSAEGSFKAASDMWSEAWAGALAETEAEALEAAAQDDDVASQSQSQPQSVVGTSLPGGGDRDAAAPPTAASALYYMTPSRAMGTTALPPGSATYRKPGMAGVSVAPPGASRLRAASLFAATSRAVVATPKRGVTFDGGAGPTAHVIDEAGPLIKTAAAALAPSLVRLSPLAPHGDPQGPALTRTKSITPAEAPVVLRGRSKSVVSSMAPSMAPGGTGAPVGAAAAFMGR